MMDETITHGALLKAHDFFLYINSMFNLGMCMEIWGDSGIHYHAKWMESKENAVYFYGRLDSNNQRKLYNYYENNLDV